MILALIGTVVGIVALLLLVTAIIVLILLLRRRKRKKEKKSEVQESTSQIALNPTEITKINDDEYEKLRDFASKISSLLSLFSHSLNSEWIRTFEFDFDHFICIQRKVSVSVEVKVLSTLKFHTLNLLLRKNSVMEVTGKCISENGMELPLLSNSVEKRNQLKK
jgi:hypothetical protein